MKSIEAYGYPLGVQRFYRAIEGQSITVGPYGAHNTKRPTVERVISGLGITLRMNSITKDITSKLQE